MAVRDTILKIIGLFDRAGRRRAIALLVLIVVAGIVETAGIVSIMPFLAVVTSPDAIRNSGALETLRHLLAIDESERFLFALGLLTVGALTLSNTIAALTSWALFRFTYHQGQRIGYRLLKTYLSQPYLFFITHNTTDLARNVYDEVPRVVTGVVLPAMQVVSKSVSVTMIVALLIVVDPVLAGLVFCAFALAYYLLHAVVQRRLARVREIASRARAESFRLASEALSGIKELKILGREEQCLKAYEAPAIAVSDADARNQQLGNLPKYLLETLAFGGIVLVVLFLLGRDDARVAALPVVALYAFAGYRLLPALQQIYSNLNYVNYYSPSLKLLDAHLAEATDVGTTEHVNADSRLRFNSRIEFDRVSFRYPTAAAPLLSDLSFQVPVHSVIGIVGRTGTGKSTVLDILVGLLSPSSGVLRIDGLALTPKLLRGWQDRIGYVPQQIYLSDGTLAENIAFGAPEEEIDRARIVDVAKAAQLHEFVTAELPEGYDTVIGERGIRLSGGQRQRIGIARALYRDSDLLVLDEATSALDNITEAAIIRTLQKFSRRKTIVLVTHRLTTLRLCDRVLLLQDGRVAHQGNYEELLQKSVVFRELDGAATVAGGRAAGGEGAG